MKNVTFSEKRDVEAIIESGVVTQDSVVSVISSIAKYNCSVKHMNDQDNCNFIKNWLTIHYAHYVETELHSVIRQKVEAAHTYRLLESDDLLIYQSELDVIVASGDIQTQKVLFALLCIAKLQKNLFGYKNGKYKFALTNIFKLARVHIPSTERNKFMHGLLSSGYIGAPFKVDDEQRYITFMSDNEDEQPVIKINEIDFYELAYVYENWKNGNKGFTRCESCGRLIKQSKTKQRKYCEECAKDAVRESWKEASKKYRDSKNNKTS
jgi:hypothetical protein